MIFVKAVAVQQSWNRTVTIATSSAQWCRHLTPPIVVTGSCSSKSSWLCLLFPWTSQQQTTVEQYLLNNGKQFFKTRLDCNELVSVVVMAFILWTFFLSIYFLQETSTQEMTEELDTTNWTKSSKYHWDMLEACNKCGKPRFHLAHAKRTWVGDGPTDCYGERFRFVCDCDQDVKYTPSKYFDIWEADARREVNCQPAGSWSNSPAHHNPCNRKYCYEPSAMAKASYKIKKQVPAHPDLQTPDQQGKYCPGSTARYFCDECHSGGGNTECLEDTTWRYVEPCAKIPGCKASKIFSVVF